MTITSRITSSRGLGHLMCFFVGLSLVSSSDFFGSPYRLLILNLFYLDPFSSIPLGLESLLFFTSHGSSILTCLHNSLRCLQQFLKCPPQGLLHRLQLNDRWIIFLSLLCHNTIISHDTILSFR
ncbi:hypothetical protein F2Q70_00016834 [Brassica cretica]|uniref:Uncharacterized protein n=1 Tax=Brassica cretica TaxID=69181 RepID=A0A8S9I3E4_BRACR|nr:hypothetical protein F2Q70_00016834 [Brassica cretica]KAF2595576.1 hypothetical protein F2Q68_00009805 [Brassica cretica]